MKKTKRIASIFLYIVAFIFLILANQYQMLFMFPLIFGLCILAFLISWDGEKWR